MIAFCAYRWKQQYAGHEIGPKTFLVSLGIVGMYYATLVTWFWHMIPDAVTKM